MSKNRSSVALMGNKPLAMKVLKYLVTKDFVDVKGVVSTKFENPYWRGNLENIANQLNIPIVEVDDLLKLPLDVIFSVNYDKLIKEPLLSHPKIGIVNMHHSYNLRYRGRYSTSFAILNARKENYWKHGTTIHFIDDKLDRGKVIATESCEIKETDTSKILFERVEKLAFKLFKQHLPSILKGNIKTSSPEQNTKCYNNLSMKDKEVNLSWTPEEIYDFVRAYTFPPFEKPYLKINSKKIYLSIV